MRKTLLLLLFAVMGFGYLVAETTLRIECVDGADYATALSVVGRWEFTDGKFILVSTSGEVLAEKANVYDVRRVVFKSDDTPTDVENMEAELTVYPNPTQDVVYVNGLESGETVRIYSLEGRLLMSEVAQGDGRVQLNVVSLAEGTYLLQMGTEIVKIIKN